MPFDVPRRVPLMLPWCLPLTRPLRSRRASMVLLGMAVLLGCGTDTSPSLGPSSGASVGALAPGTPLVPGTPDAPREINVIMRDYLFEPDPIRLVPGETVRFNVVNAGLLAHELVLGGPVVQAAWASAEAAATPPGFTATPPPVSLPPGTAGLRVFVESGGFTTVDYAVPLGEQLELACHIPGHLAQGMVGTVELVEAEGP